MCLKLDKKAVRLGRIKQILIEHASRHTTSTSNANSTLTQNECTTEDD